MGHDRVNYYLCRSLFIIVYCIKRMIWNCHTRYVALLLFGSPIDTMMKIRLWLVKLKPLSTLKLRFFLIICIVFNNFNKHDKNLSNTCTATQILYKFIVTFSFKKTVPLISYSFRQSYELRFCQQIFLEYDILIYIF